MDTFQIFVLRDWLSVLRAVCHPSQRSGGFRAVRATSLGRHCAQRGPCKAMYKDNGQEAWAEQRAKAYSRYYVGNVLDG